MSNNILKRLYRHSIKLSIALIVLLIGQSVKIFGQESSSSKQPNVILIMTDDQGYGDLACHGNTIIKTPNIDKLHAESTRLTNFHVSPTCAPTRAALMTGHYTNRTGVWHTIGGRSLLRKDEVTIADVFSENKYETAIFGKWHLGDNYPYRPQDRGFKEVLVHGAGGVGQTPDYFDNDYYDDTYIHNGEFKKYKGYCTDVWFGEAMKYIEQQKDKPFFCYISTNAPHGPFYVDDSYSKPYEGIANVPGKEFYGMITNVDDNVGVLTKKLEELGIADNTILIFMTDNGSTMGEHKSKDITPFNAGMRGKKNSEYDGGHRVPFFIKWKNGKIEEGKDIANITAHIDVLPTLIELCNLKSKVDFDGESLVPLIKEDDSKWKDRILITDSQRVEHPVKWRKSAVMTDKYRLVNGKELYKITEDPAQQNDIAKEHPELVSKYRVAYENWWSDVSEKFHEYAAISVGTKQENPLQLTSHDWHSESQVPWNHKHIRTGIQENGYWVLDIEKSGTYEITLSRWPLYLNKGIQEGLAKRPAIEGTSVNKSAEGKALMLTHSKMKIGTLELEEPISSNATYISFTVKLTKGEGQHLQTWFTGENLELGAYYVDILKI